MFLRTHSGELISIGEIIKIHTIEHAGGGSTIVATLRSDGTTIRLCRSYTIEALARALDPTKGSR